MRQHSENAQLIANWLEAHPAVARVYYPGLESFPQKALADKQQRAPGGMLSFELKVGAKVAIQVMNQVKLCARAESMGAVETLITHPVTATHSDIPAEIREQWGITERLVRLSVGLEAPEDIIADLDQAFAAVLGADREGANDEIREPACQL